MSTLTLKLRLEKLKNILLGKNAKIYATSSIMRISNNNVNQEEKEYWKDFGKKIFEYSFNFHKLGSNKFTADIPEEILNDYINTRKNDYKVLEYRNME